MTPTFLISISCYLSVGFDKKILRISRQAALPYSGIIPGAPQAGSSLGAMHPTWRGRPRGTDAPQ
jgi:hypothetical protein